MGSMSRPSVSVVISSWNRRERLLETLSQLVGLPERPTVIVVDNGSTDGTAEAVRRRFPSVRLLALSENLGIEARNIGVEAAQSRFVALSDDDSWWAPGSLSKGATALRDHPSLGLVAARVLVEPGGRVDPTSLEMARSPLATVDQPGRPVLGFLGCGAIVRRSAFLEAGGFCSRFFIGGEEELLAIDLARLGWGLSFLEEVTVHHQAAGREGAQRQKRVLRNGLWVAVMRRPLAVVGARLNEVIRRARHDPVVRDALVEAIGGLPWALSQRQVVPPWLESQLRLLESW